MTLIHPKQATRLHLAVEKFNAALGYEMALPIEGWAFENMVDIAQMRGRTDIAAELKAALEHLAVRPA
jgi:hypothetical protein